MVEDVHVHAHINPLTGRPFVHVDGTTTRAAGELASGGQATVGCRDRHGRVHGEVVGVAVDQPAKGTFLCSSDCSTSGRITLAQKKLARLIENEDPDSEGHSRNHEVPNPGRSGQGAGVVVGMLRGAGNSLT